MSTHGYANDTVENLFHTKESIPMDERVCQAVQKVHSQIAASHLPNVPLMWTEWNVPSFGELHARDTVYVGAALADDIRQCDGLVDMMSFWTFSDVFEENGPKQEPFDGGFGLIAMSGIKKPSYAAFALLHKLGTERLFNSASDVLATRGGDGNIVIAVWNLVDPDHQGRDESFHLRFRGISPDARVFIQYVDRAHANSCDAYRALGSPRYPTQEQVEEINRVAETPGVELTHLNDASIDFTLSANGLAVIKVGLHR